jgi:hypothetical protein
MATDILKDSRQQRHQSSESAKADKRKQGHERQMADEQRKADAKNAKNPPEKK